MANVIFVDENDRVIGAGSRKEALEKGVIHRVVRIFITNSKGEILLQRRSKNVAYPDRWDQSVGGHVDEGETYEQAAHREMEEEVGVEGIELHQVEKYYTAFGDFPRRKRFNMLYTVVYDGEIKSDPEEVSEVRWVSPAHLDEWISRSPQEFTEGCIKAYQRYKAAVPR